MESLARVLAEEFARLGHRPTVATETAGQKDFPYPIVRRPSAFELLRLARRADVILSLPLSLKRLPVLAAAGRPVVIAHPIKISPAGRFDWRAKTKLQIAKRFPGIVPSHYLAEHFPGSVVIGNPYDAATFDLGRSNPKAKRGGIVHAGRLIPGKGAQVLIDAFARIAAKFPDEQLTIIGEGPARPTLEALIARHGLGDRVKLVGERQPAAVAPLLAQARIMAVPTLDEEAFGIVALEGLASGCRLIVANLGGLPEATGNLALTHAPGDEVGLARCISAVLSEEAPPPSAAALETHLARFTPEAVATRYIKLFEGLS
ncbi:glycosyltransferase family 4 protein [Novosphingobium ginsenosidimutans]|nr:glycosyltransferase family 4 protein [Novosphingobium ginsenosidimutans]